MGAGLFWEDLPKLPPKRGADAKLKAGAGRGPRPISDWGGPPKEYPRIPVGSVVALDTETRDPELTTRGPGWAYEDSGEIVGVSLAWGESGKGYWPIAHEGTAGEDPFALHRDEVLGFVRSVVSRSDVTVVMHNALYDLGWLQREGVKVKARVEDTMVYAPLLDEHSRSFKLDSLAKRYLKAEGKNETLLRSAAEWYGVDPKGGLWRLPSAYVGPYAEDDARLTLDLRNRLMAMAEEAGLMKIVNLEHRLIPILLAMRTRGIRIDQDHVGRLEEKWGRELEDLSAKWRLESPWNAADVWRIARGRPGVSSPALTATGAPSITKDWLKVNGADEFLAAVAKMRQLDKLLNTFIRGALTKHVDPTNGRVFPQFHALRSDEAGAAPGRFSSSNPNVQQVPKRGGEIALEVRKCFLPEEGMKWCSSDYSQQEPRLTVHYSALIGATGASEIVRRWNEDPFLDFHQMTAEIAGITRQQGKTINLGLTYGMGEETLAENLGLSLREAKLVTDQYFERLPFIREISYHVQNRAREKGYIVTFGGRRNRFPAGEKLHAALNRLIQGSAADQTKQAMVNIYERHGMVPHISLHDELCFSVESKEHADRVVKAEMEGAYKLLVPSIADVVVSANWGTKA